MRSNELEAAVREGFVRAVSALQQAAGRSGGLGLYAPLSRFLGCRWDLYNVPAAAKVAAIFGVFPQLQAAVAEVRIQLEDEADACIVSWWTNMSKYLLQQ
jgi:hypothetical protein